MNRRVGRIGYLAAIALAAFALGCGAKGEVGAKRAGGGPGASDPSARKNGEARREYAVPVGVYKIMRRPMSEYVSTVGTVAPIRSVAVKPEDSGRIHFVKPWRQGQYVRKGELLACLDEEETSRAIEITQADLETARSQLALALARLERTRTDFDRAKVMFKLGQISRKAYEERQFNANSAQINYEESVIRVKKAEKSLERLLIQMDRKKIRAPMSGYLITRGAYENRNNPSAADTAEEITDLEGQRVSVGQVICGIIDTSSVLIRCDVTSKDIAKIKKGQPAQAFVYSAQEIPLTGRVAEVSQVMDFQTRAFRVDVEAPNPGGRVRPGMFARVNIIVKTHRDAIVVDRKIIQRRNNRDVVFVVNDQGRAEMRVVKIGLENPDEVEITDGLKEGEKLVVLGYETLQDKVKVKVVETELTIGRSDEKTTAVGVTQAPGNRG